MKKRVNSIDLVELAKYRPSEGDERKLEELCQRSGIHIVQGSQPT